MKYIKKYESHTEPQIGDWVYCSNEPKFAEGFENHIKDKIGQIINTEDFGHLRETSYFVTYRDKNSYYAYHRISEVTDDPKFLSKYKNCIVFDFERDDIKFFSKRRKDVEMHLDALRYNL